ncbi:hypothetical protein PGTUg99_021056 [Puccinia graminis f. sp. tritici]|uniref:MULE transposase domain-containing protein n=1 Tax=Puccinia graminis f. sp. tritici TaxID=56615 RepID=A0A5B0LM37_PUCGR|nr:hypothetical protein PGTUg99_021056 [Puccinia graminis f. sp. tritici]
MQATVFWNAQRTQKRKSGDEPTSGRTGRPVEHSFRLDFKCPRARTYTAVPNSCKNWTLSRKCDCKAQFSIFHHIRTNSLRVEWEWKHNHDPFSAEEIQKNRTPKMVEAWLTERVIAGLNWNAILQLMRCADIFAMNSETVTPEGGIVKYDHVRHLIRTRMGVLAKRNPDPFESIRMWEGNLRQQSWNTFLPNSSNSGNFLFAFQSMWQRQQLINHGRGMIMIDSTHNSVDNGSLVGGRVGFVDMHIQYSRTFSLYTVVIRDPVVGKGLPVCWAFTASAAAEPVEALMKWLRHTTGVVPCAVMSDCAQAIKKGVNAAYSDLGEQAPKIYWCIFHILKAFKNRATTYLHELANNAFLDFRQVLYDETNTEVKMTQLCQKWEQISLGFGDYVKTQWHNNIVHWAMYYCSVSVTFTYHQDQRTHS